MAVEEEVKRKFVLINDDEVELANLIKEKFESMGFEAQATYCCHQALDVIRDKTPDLLITDIRMPGMTGDELISKLLDLEILIPVIAMSGHVSFESDTFMFLPKPFSIDHVVEFVNSYLDEITDTQLLKNVAKKNGLDEESVGKVILFYPEKGWGLLNVIGCEKAVYVNASDILPKKSFSQLFRGQVVSFQLNSGSPKGPRAEGVTVIFDRRKRKNRRPNA